MRVALVYDRLNKLGGAERVLEAFADLFPSAHWYTSTYNPQKTPFTQNWQVTSSFLSRLPYIRDHHEYLPMLMPFIFESFDFSAYDLVISIGSAECKGIITKPATVHLHYCLTPTRYLYSHHADYLQSRLQRALAKPLRAWDQVASTRPDEMIAISTQVKKRIKQYYHRDSEVIFPPVALAKYQNPKRTATDLASLGLPSSYFLVVSRLVPYKQIDQLVRVFAKLPKHHLVIAGTGSQWGLLQQLASPNVKLLGYVPDDQLPALYSGSTAFLQANEEDFGISMVEAQGSGVPVIAYGVGGACDIVQPGKTGILLPDNQHATWIQAIDNFDPKRFDKEACRANARRFDIKIWKEKITRKIKQIYE